MRGPAPESGVKDSHSQGNAGPLRIKMAAVITLEIGKGVAHIGCKERGGRPTAAGGSDFASWHSGGGRNRSGIGAGRWVLGAGCWVRCHL